MKLIFLAILAFITGRCDGACYSAESCLYDSLFTNYQKQVRPGISPSSTVDVSLAMSLIAILNLDEKLQVFETVAKVKATWNDGFLQWNTTQYPVQMITVSADSLWLPDFATGNGASGMYNSDFKDNFRVQISNSGSISWSFGGVFQTTCTLSLSKYPLDEQQCSIILRNWDYIESLVNLTSGEFSTSNTQNHSLWDISASSVEAIEIEGLPGYKFTVKLSRKTEYYIINVIMPIVLLTLTTLGVFWLPADCGEKVSLSITILLAFSVFQIVIMDNTPVNSVEIPLVTQLVTCLMILSTISVLSSMLAIHLSNKKSNSRPPACVRTIFFGCLAKVFCLSAEVPDIDENQIDVIEIKSRDDKNANGMVEIGKKGAPTDDFVMLELLNELRFLTSHVKDQGKDDAVIEEWKLVAKLTDRCLFFIALVTIFIVMIVLFA